MLARKMILATVLLCAFTFGAVGCGNQTTFFGFQSFTLTSVAPNPVPGMIPTSVVITGGDWTNLVGTPVEVTYFADGGFTPFNGGTVAIETMPGTITSPTTIATITPAATICGPASITASIGVTMPSGVYAQSGAGFITFLAPVLTSVANTGGVIAGAVFDAAVPETATITGANYGDTGGTVTVYWRSTPAGAGAALFEAGSSMTTTTIGTVVSSTTITTTSPLALVCGAAITTLPAEIYRIDFRDGSCTETPPPAGAGPTAALVFRAPRIVPAGGGVTNASVGTTYAGSTAPAMFAGAVPEPFTIAGTGFGPVGGTVTIRWTSAAGTLIYDAAVPNPLPALPTAFGTSATTTVTGTITSRTAISATAHPGAAVCSVAMDAQNIMVTLPDGACTPSAIDGLGSATQIGPTLTAVDNIDRNLGTTNGAVHPAPNSMGYFYPHIPERFQLTGTDFGPVGGTALVQMTYLNTNGFADPAMPFPSAAGGPETSTTIVLPCTITSRTTLEGVMPDYRMALTRGAAGIAGVNFAHIRPIADLMFTAVLEGGSCNMTLFDPAGVEVTAHTVSPGVGAAGGPGTDVVSTIRLGETEPDMVTITGIGFGPPGPCTVIFEDATAFSGFDGGAAEANGTEAMIVSDTTVTCRLPTVTAPRLIADMLARVVVRVANGSEAFCNQDVNFVAPPTITTITNMDTVGAALPSFLTGLPGTDYIPCHASTMSIVGTGFDIAGAPAETATTIYDLNSGVGPAPGVVPVRRLGTLTPVGNDLGDAATYTAALTTTTIAGRIRLEPSLDDLDTDRDGLVTARVRCVNMDGQFHETGAVAPLDPVYRTIGRAVPPGAVVPVPPDNYDNTSVAIDPSSFTDDFATAPSPNDAATDGINLFCVTGSLDPGATGVFLSTDASTFRSLDGGHTWTGAAAAGIAGSEVGFPAPVAPTRAFFHAEYDAFGNLWMAYVRSDFFSAPAQDDIVLMQSSDNGVTWTQAAVLATGFPGAYSSCHLSVGPRPGGERVGVTWVDAVNFVVGSLVQAHSVDVTGLGAFVAPAALGPANDVSDPVVPPPAFFLLDAKCAIGPGGELYVTWQEPDAAFATTTFRTDVDQDGLTGAASGFNVGLDAAIAAASIPGGFTPIPSAPDTGGFLPHTDVAVAQAGANSGRLCFAYTNVVPGALVPPPARDYVQVLTRVSDDNGDTWSSASSPHQIDTADRYMPSITSDRVNGRFHCAWYDTQTTPPGGPFTTATRQASASDNGILWGTQRDISVPIVPTAWAPNANNDFGLYADIVANAGCVFAGWSSPAFAGGLTNDPIVVIYSQNAR